MEGVLAALKSIYNVVDGLDTTGEVSKDLLEVITRVEGILKNNVQVFGIAMDVGGEGLSHEMVVHGGVLEAVSVSQSKYWYVEYMESSEDGECEEKSTYIARHPNDWIKCKREYMDIVKREGLPFSTFEITATHPVEKKLYQQFIESGRR